MMGNTEQPGLMALKCLQPSQLFISEEKLSKVQSMYDYTTPIGISPIPIKKLDGLWVLTDGHTRALAAHLAGLTEVPTFTDPDDLDWSAYRICVGWCHASNIFSVLDLVERVVSSQDYERLWYDRCRKMQADEQHKRLKK